MPHQTLEKNGHNFSEFFFFSSMIALVPAVLFFFVGFFLLKTINENLSLSRSLSPCVYVHVRLRLCVYVRASPTLCVYVTVCAYVYMCACMFVCSARVCAFVSSVCLTRSFSLSFSLCPGRQNRGLEKMKKIWSIKAFLYKSNKSLISALLLSE